MKINNPSTINFKIEVDDMTPPTPTDVIERFAKEFGNPDVFDSSSAFSKDKQGRLYPEFLRFLLQELERARRETIEKLYELKWSVHNPKGTLMVPNEVLQTLEEEA